MYYNFTNHASYACITDFFKTKHFRYFMRINTIILLVLCLTHQMLSASVGKAQALSETNVTLELKNETLRDALKQIESQTEFRFAYKKKAINAYSTINLERSTLSVESLLGVLLSNNLSSINN